jgi:hypothetical protein
MHWCNRETLHLSGINGLWLCHSRWRLR